MQFKKLLIGTSAVALMSLAACGGATSGQANGGQLPSTAPTNFANTPVTEDPKAQGPVTIDGATPGGTITMLSTSTLTDENLDPAEAYVQDTMIVDNDLLVRSLTQWKWDAQTKQDILVPDLATDLGTPNKDYTKWTFTIRDGAKWEDGTPVTAAQVGMGIDRTFDSTTFPRGAGPYYSVPYFKGGDKYKGPYTSPGAKDQAVSVSGNTITLTMAKPFPDMPYYAAMPLMGAVWTPTQYADTYPPTSPKAYPDPKTYSAHPMSDGPYKISKWQDGKLLDLVKNTNWDPATDPGRTQYPNEYKFEIGDQPDQIDQILLGDTGSGKTTFSWDGVQASTYSKFNKDATLKQRLVTGTSPCTTYWAFDMKKIPDVNVRRAIGLAYPYKDAIAAGGSIPGVDVVPATQLLPPGIAGRIDDFSATGEPGWTTDTAKAKQLLDQAGKTGFKLTWIWENTSPQAKAANDAVVKGLKAAGFDPEPLMVPDSKFWDDVFTPPASVNVDVTTGWCSDWPSAFTWIPQIFKTGGPNNFGKYSNPAADKQMDKILTMPLDQQAAAWGALDKQIESTDYPIMEKSYQGIAQAFGSDIGGYSLDPAAGMPSLANLYVKSGS